jgi:hypothetical protein
VHLSKFFIESVIPAWKEEKIVVDALDDCCWSLLFPVYFYLQLYGVLLESVQCQIKCGMESMPKKCSFTAQADCKYSSALENSFWAANVFARATQK